MSDTHPEITQIDVKLEFLEPSEDMKEKLKANFEPFARNLSSSFVSSYCSIVALIIFQSNVTFSSWGYVPVKLEDYVETTHFEKLGHIDIAYGSFSTHYIPPELRTSTRFS